MKDTELELQDIARVTGASISTVHGWTARGGLASRKSGRSRKVRADDLIAFLDVQGRDEDSVAIRGRLFAGEFLADLLASEEAVFGMIGALRNEHGLTHSAAMRVVAGMGLLLMTAADRILDGPFATVKGPLLEIGEAMKADRLEDLAREWWPGREAA